jgi:hypothetical protein
MNTNIGSQISSIIPTMILGIFLILAWFPTIIFTEINNKGNDNEYKQLLTYISDDTLTLTPVTLNYTPISTATSGANLSTFKLGDYYTVPLNLITDNNNLYLRSIIETTTTTTDSSNKQITTTTIGRPEHLDLGRPDIGGISMDLDDYRYLAMQNILKTEQIEKTDGNVKKKYTIDIYSIPKDKEILKVGGLQQHEEKLDMTIYDYEFGPEESAKETIKQHKSNTNLWIRWLGRLGTFLMLAGGLTSIVSPLRTLNNLLGQLPWFLNIIAIPGQIILSIWDSLSIFGSLLLTALMTLLVWTVINKPMYAIIIVSLIAGLTIYFKYKK